MPKTIDYPRTTYLSAWEVAEVVDDTGGKCSIEACARKLNRKVSGSFKAILGSAVKFGLLTSKRELLTTTNLYRRIKHAYDKQEEKIYHREAFLHPPLFMHICRKFRNRELPVHMFDVMLIREFGVEEINAQNVARAFVEGARMVDILNEQNVIADVDKLTQATPRRDMASPEMPVNIFPSEAPGAAGTTRQGPATPPGPIHTPVAQEHTAFTTRDAVSSLFGFSTEPDHFDDDLDLEEHEPEPVPEASARVIREAAPVQATPVAAHAEPRTPAEPAASVAAASIPKTLEAHPAEAVYTIRISGPGIDSQLIVQDEYDLDIVNALLGKIRKQLLAAQGK